MAEEAGSYNKGDAAPDDANYVCVPCGYNRYFRKGEVFTECMSCLSGTPHGEDEYAEGLELWEKAPDQTPQ